MSNEKEEFQKNLEKVAAARNREASVKEKELLVRERKVDNTLDLMQLNDKDLELAKTIDFAVVSDDRIQQIRTDNFEYMDAAKRSMTFINKAFDGIIPFFRKNLVLIGGKTGEGKSTTVANVVASTIRQTNPETGKKRKVLVITNEESVEDVYNRVTCLAKGWHYVNHNKFTDEQLRTFDEYIQILAKDSWLQVIDDRYQGGSGVTTSIEGIRMIFDKLLASPIKFDAIIIDYYQNVMCSKLNPSLDEYKAQGIFASMLDTFKNNYPAPIILMAQVKPPDKEDSVPFKHRVEGRKVILNKVTACVEMVADRENLRTEWTIHKSRFNESIGSKFYTGYDKGRFTVYDETFRSSVERIKVEKMHKVFDKNSSSGSNKEGYDGNSNEGNGSSEA